MYTVAERLTQYMETYGLRKIDLADITGIPKGSITRYVAGTVEPKRSAIAKMAIAMNVDPTWLTGYDVPMHKGKEIDDSVVVPIIGRVAAGLPILAQENVIGQVRCSERQARGCELFALEIKGDSMSPIIKDGDTVIVRRQDDAETGDIVIALVDGQEDGICKKLQKYSSGIALLSINPVYDPIISNDVKIIGRVIESRTTF